MTITTKGEMEKVSGERLVDGMPEWRCAGCGKSAPTKARSCDCPTGLVVTGTGRGMRSEWDAENSMKIFMTWVNQGPALAKAAGVYVGIKIYASEDAARSAGDIS